MSNSTARPFASKARRSFFVWSLVAVVAWIVVPRAFGVSVWAFGLPFVCAAAFAGILAYFQYRNAKRRLRGDRD